MMGKKLIQIKLRASWLLLPGLMLLLVLVKCSLVESTPPNVRRTRMAKGVI